MLFLQWGGSPKHSKPSVPAPTPNPEKLAPTSQTVYLPGPCARHSAPTHYLHHLSYPPDPQVVSAGGQQVRVDPLGVGDPHDLGGRVGMVEGVPAHEL